MRDVSQNRIHPHVFALYLGMGSIIMMFIALTSAYIVRQAAGNWLEFPVPRWFFYSTAIIFLSSLSIHISYKAYIRQDKATYRWGLVLTFITSIIFLWMQYLGWMTMTGWGVYFNGNPSGSFVYVLSGLHAAHLLGGITALIIALIHAFTLPFSYKEYRKRRFNLTVQYWHFVSVLWLYLLLFLIIQQ